MQEEILYQWWQYYAQYAQTINCQGHLLRIIEVGEFNPSCGPDFISARFELDGITLQGDVECHVKAEDWYRHQHHLDKRYRSVVLHIVAQVGKHPEVSNAWNKKSIPVLSLPEPSTERKYLHPAQTCSPSRYYPDSLTEDLKSLALERFWYKVKMFQKILTQENESEVFYQYFFRVLGYPHNPEAFQYLAQRISFQWLIEHQKQYSGNPHLLYALYAGQASFLTGQPRDAYSRFLGQIYECYRYSVASQAMDILQWQFAATRPCNHPHFRLAAWIYLLTNRSLKILPDLWDILSARKDPDSTLAEIENYFLIEVSGYWSGHYALGKHKKGTNSRIFFGKARIYELLINLILPLFTVKTLDSGSYGFNDYIEDFFWSIPLVSTYQSLDRILPWAEQCLELCPRQSACQALLHLKRMYCDQSACTECPLHRQPADFAH